MAWNSLDAARSWLVVGTLCSALAACGGYDPEAKALEEEPDKSSSSPSGSSSSASAASSGTSGSTFSSGTSQGSAASCREVGVSQQSCPQRPIYVAQRVRSLVPPVPDPIGVSCQDDGLWLLSGTLGAVPRLVFWDLSSGELTVDTQLLGVGHPAYSGFSGLAVAEDGAWLSVAGQVNQIYHVDTATGEALRVMGSPAELGPTDLELDQGKLLVGIGTGAVYALTLDAVPEQTVVVDLPGYDRDYGVAVRGDEVFVGGLFGRMWVYTHAGVLLGEVARQDGWAFIQGETGTMCFRRGELVVADSAGLTFYSLVPVSP